jgi:DNA-binding GntR family transcriptional regulator
VAAKGWRLAGVERASVTEQVLRELREAIVDGRIPQGEQLREASLAETLGTGRSAIREAVRQLVQEGLVDHEPHRGACVRRLSLRDRLDVYVAREAIESGAARHAVQAAEPPGIASLRAAFEALRAAAPQDADVTERLIAADLEFHRELVRLAGSPRLSRAHDTLIAETRMLLRHHPPYPVGAYVSDHERLLLAIERRDPRAPDLVAEHLRLSARLIADGLASQGEEVGVVS